MSFARRVVVIVGVGNGTGTGAAVARLFTKEGYSAALLARQKDSLEQLAEELNLAGGDAAAFPLTAYSADAIVPAWTSIKERFPTPIYEIRVCFWNAAQEVFKKFLDITQEDVGASLQIIDGAFAFAKQAILTFKENEIDLESGKRGTLLFTGATASLRGSMVTSAFAASKFAVRALSQSLNKGFGKENIHVAHVVVDGVILTDFSRSHFSGRSAEWEANKDDRLEGTSIAKAHLYLVKQDRSAWTWELDLRPAHEKW